MFCENCGKPIPDGQHRCSDCAAVAQQPAPVTPKFERAPMDLGAPASTSASAPSPDQASTAQAPAYAAPAYEAPVMASAAPQPAESAPPAFTLNTPAEGKKKGKKGKLILGIIAAVLLVAIVLCVVFWGSISRFFKRTFSDPAEYMQDVEKENASSAAKEIASAYDEMMDAYSATNTVTESRITFEVSDAIRVALESALAQAGLDLDLGWVESVTLSPKTAIYENTLRYDCGLEINNTNLATVSLVWDFDTQTIYLGIPELNKTFLEADAEEIFGSDAAMMADYITSSRQIMQDFVEAMPDGEQIEDLINTYSALLIGTISEAEQENKTVKLGSVEQDLLVLTANLSQKDILESLRAILETAKDDKTLKDILLGLESFVETNEGTEIDMYSSFCDSLETACNDLEELFAEAGNSTILTVETYLDDDDQIAGRTFTFIEGDEEISIHYITVVEGDKFATEVELGSMTFSGKGTIDNGKSSGKYTLSVEGVDLVNIKTEDCDDTSGTFRFSFESALFEDYDLAASSVIGQLTLVVGLSEDTVSIAIEAMGTELLGFDIYSKVSDSDPIELPDSIRADTDADGEKWLSELDLDGLLDNLDKAGIPSDYMGMVEQVVDELLPSSN